MDLMTQKVTLGAVELTLTELPFKRLKKVVPLMTSVMPQLQDGVISEAVFDAMLAVVLLAQADGTPQFTREQLEEQVIKPQQLSDAVGVIARLCALDKTPEGADPKGKGESASTGTTSTLS